jgi:hypothetical protein
MRPYTHHQNELSRFTVRGLRELDERLDDLALDTQSAIARLQTLVARTQGGHRALRFGEAVAASEAGPAGPVLELPRDEPAARLRALDDGSVPALHAAQVVEHLDAERLTELLGLMQRKLAPGGAAVIETVDTERLSPEALLALCRLAGFGCGEVRFAQASGDLDADRYLNRDYTVIARNAGSA